MISRDRLPSSIKQPLRERAIKNSKVRVSLSPKSIADLTEAELEIIVKEEEDKIIAKLKTYSITALAALLGISWV